MVQEFQGSQIPFLCILLELNTWEILRIYSSICSNLISKTNTVISLTFNCFHWLKIFLFVLFSFIMFSSLTACFASVWLASTFLCVSVVWMCPCGHWPSADAPSPSQSASTEHHATRQVPYIAPSLSTRRLAQPLLFITSNIGLIEL